MPTIENGGIEKNLILLSDYLIENGYEVKILTRSIRLNMRLAINKRVKIIISKEYYKLNFTNKRINDSLNVFLHVWKNRNYFKKYIFLSFQSHYIGVIISKFIKTKIILRIANHPLVQYNFFKISLNTILNLLKNFIYRFSDGIITNSKESLNYLKIKILKMSLYTYITQLKI